MHFQPIISQEIHDLDAHWNYLTRQVQWNPTTYVLIEKYKKNISIMKTRLFKYMYIENFTTKNWKFSDKNSDIFHISVQNIVCGYSLELPCWAGSNKKLYKYVFVWWDVPLI